MASIASPRTQSALRGAGRNAHLRWNSCFRGPGIYNLGARSFAQQLLMPLAKVAVGRIAHPPEEALCAVATPIVGVVPVAFEAMREQQIFEIGAGSESVILFAADAAMGHLLIPFCTGKARDRRVRAAVRTAHDEVLDAVACLGHGGPSFQG
jgi:hypothetical protein